MNNLRLLEVVLFGSPRSSAMADAGGSAAHIPPRGYSLSSLEDRLQA